MAGGHEKHVRKHLILVCGQSADAREDPEGGDNLSILLCYEESLGSSFLEFAAELFPCDSSCDRIWILGMGIVQFGNEVGVAVHIAANLHGITYLVDVTISVPLATTFLPT